jgi:hypothetical protein
MIIAILYGLVCLFTQIKFSYNVFLALLVAQIIINMINVYGKIKISKCECKCSNKDVDNDNIYS